jgi:EAL domain-containing protein (putative c-di-GMP-specific phosphodiesterase class I)/CheY-like chemotaxis protein
MRTFGNAGDGAMDNLRPEDATKIATGRRQTRSVCVADDQQQMRTFLAETLEELGFVTCECAHVAELAAVLASRLLDLVVIGSSAGGIEACEMVEMLAAKEFDGKVLVLGPRVSPMVAVIRELGEKLGLAMLPLLPTPFSQGDVRDCIAALMPIESPPNQPIGAAEAVDAGSLELWYQPKIDIRTLALSGAEALTRVRQSTLGTMPPGYFMPGDGDSGVNAFSEFVIERAFSDWRYFAAQYGHIELAINLPIAFFRVPEAIKNLCRQIPDHPAFEGLIIEINAADVIRNLELVKDVARLYRYRTIAISIDNLGAEWPSLSGLDDFPFVELKVARQFIAGCAGDRRKQTTCRRIIDLADAMGARTVADGVETRADLIAVLEMGFHLAQGSLLATPMTAKTFARAVLGRRAPWSLA